MVLPMQTLPLRISHPWVAASWLLCSACAGRDPILDRAEALDGDARPGDAPATVSPPAPQRVQAAAPTPAPAPPPAPGTPPAPAPGEAGAPPPPGGEASVTVRGVVVLPDHKGGPIRIDAFDGDQRAASGGGPRPGVVGMARLEAPGPFTLQIPASTSQVWLGAFADEDQDGKPGPLDPEVWYAGNPLTITPDAPELTLVLQRRDPPPGR